MTDIVRIKVSRDIGGVWKVVPVVAPVGFLSMDVVTPSMGHLDGRTITVHLKQETQPNGNPTGRYQIAYRRVPDPIVGSVIELLEAQDTELGEGFITLWYNDIARYFEARATTWMFQDKFERWLANG